MRWLMLAVFLSSCTASANFLRDSDGNIVRVEAEGNISAKAKSMDGSEVEVDAKYTDFLKGLLHMNKL